MTLRVDSASIPVVNVTFANNHINQSIAYHIKEEEEK